MGIAAHIQTEVLSSVVDGAGGEIKLTLGVLNVPSDLLGFFVIPEVEECPELLSVPGDSAVLTNEVNGVLGLHGVGREV